MSAADLHGAQWWGGRTTCPCHPDCRAACRAEEHPSDSSCVWPDCLTEAEARAELVRYATEAGDR